MFARFIGGFAALLCCTLSSGAEARFWQCAPYARMVSGVDIRGNALTWWSQAAGRYARGVAPKAGAVMAFAATSRMRLGHVATVARVLNDREVLLNHANWSRRGGVESGVRAVDVSAAGNWSQVRVFFASVGGLGTSSYPVNGFIYAGVARTEVRVAAASPVPVLGTGHVDPAQRAASFSLDLE